MFEMSARVKDLFQYTQKTNFNIDDNYYTYINIQEKVIIYT